MDNITKIDNLTRVTRRRDFEDGLMDFVFAVTFLFLGGLGGVFLSPLGLRWYFTSLLWNREVTIIAGIVLVFLFILIVFGDILGIPILPPYYTLRLLPYVVPSFAGWKRSMLRERDLTDLCDAEIT